MSKHNTFLVLLLYFLYTPSTAKSSTDPNPSAADFIKAECGATLYPALCIQYVSSYSTTIQKSPKQLARAALSVSLSRAQSVFSFVSKMAMMKGLKPIEHPAVKDCIANMANTVDQLSRSLKELDGMGQGLEWHESNVESWVGAALTFENTCVDGFRSPVMDGNVKFAITKRVLDCARITSIALALVHRYVAARHKAGGANLP